MIAERIAVWLVAFVAIGCVAAGFFVAIRSGDPHWMNRFGALIVCIECFLILVEFYRRLRIQQAERELAEPNPYFHIEAVRAEKSLLFLGVSMVSVGEFLHGFGDLVFLLFLRVLA